MNTNRLLPMLLVCALGALTATAEFAEKMGERYLKFVTGDIADTQRVSNEEVWRTLRADDLGRLLAAVYDQVGSSLGTGRVFRYFRDAVADFDGLAMGNGSLVTFLEVFVNVLQEAADNEDEEEAKKAVRAVAEAFRDVADVTLPAPTVVGNDAEGIETGSLPSNWVPPLPWWFGNPGMFECRVVDITNVRCVRRPDDGGDEGLPSTGRHSPGMA